MSTAQSISRDLDRLHSLRLEVEAIVAKHQAKRDKILAPFRDQLAAIAAAELATVAVALAKVEKLEEQIKAAVAEQEASVLGSHLQAVYTPPKPVWNDDMLQGMAKHDPEILDARSLGKASVSIRKVAMAARGST